MYVVKITDCLGEVGDLTVPENEQELASYWEVEEGQTQVMDVQGHLMQSLEFWVNVLKPAPWIIDCIREGYKLPLRTISDCYQKLNQRSAIEHKEFVSEAIQKL